MASPWLLIISKHPVYTESGEVALGQCEPYTPGWRMRLYRDGEEIVLLEGSYYDLRKVQQECADKPVDQIKQIASEAKEKMRSHQEATLVLRTPGHDTVSGTDVTELDGTQVLGTQEIQQALAEMQPPPAEDDDDETGEYVDATGTAPFEIVKVHGVVVATTVDPSILDTASALLQGLELLMSESSGALILDIGPVERLGKEPADVIGEFTEESERAGRFVALANVREQIVDALREMDINGTLVAFADVESAVAEARAFLDKKKNPES